MSKSVKGTVRTANTLDNKVSKVSKTALNHEFRAVFLLFLRQPDTPLKVILETKSVSKSLPKIRTPKKVTISQICR